MSAPTRWALARKKTVVIALVVLAMAGATAAGAASDNQGAGGDAAPLRPFVTVPAGASVDDRAGER